MMKTNHNPIVSATAHKSCSDFVIGLRRLTRDTRLQSALEKFVNNLDDAFATGATNDEQVEKKRVRYVAGLAAFHGYLCSIARELCWTAASKHAEQFRILGDALADLNVGVVWRIMAPSRKEKSIIPSRLKLARDHVVFALNVLIDGAGVAREDAAKEVLKRFPGITGLFAGKSNSPKRVSTTHRTNTILGWRTDFNAPSRHKSDMAKSALNHRDVIDGLPPEHCREFAHEILRKAERVALSITDPAILSQPPWELIYCRTSHQIQTQADPLLGLIVIDIDGNSGRQTENISVFNRCLPTDQSLKIKNDEITTIGAWFERHVKAGLMPHEFGLFVRSVGQLDRAQAAAKKAGVPFKVLDDNVEATGGHISIGAMHSAKGLQFRAVAVMACDDEIVPSQERIETIGDDADLQEVYDTERRLLYVALLRRRLADIDDCLALHNHRRKESVMRCHR
jgi:hypothetical protein